MLGFQQSMYYSPFSARFPLSLLLYACLPVVGLMPSPDCIKPMCRASRHTAVGPGSCHSPSLQLLFICGLPFEFKQPRPVMFADALPYDFVTPCIVSFYRTVNNECHPWMCQPSTRSLQCTQVLSMIRFRWAPFFSSEQPTF